MKNKTNKIRNAYLVSFFCLVNICSYGQTKEETISWLKEKLTSFLDDKSDSIKDIKLESINECEFIVTYNLRTGYVTGLGGVMIAQLSKYRLTFPITDIIIDKYGNIEYEKQVLGYQINNSKIDYSVGTDLKFRDGENDIYVRIKKAFDHLATFCPKKKETF